MACSFLGLPLFYFAVEVAIVQARDIYRSGWCGRDRLETGRKDAGIRARGEVEMWSALMQYGEQQSSVRLETRRHAQTFLGDVFVTWEKDAATGLR